MTDTIDIKMPVRGEDGVTRHVPTITSNEDHVANLIATGAVLEANRWREIARLYKGQLAAKQRECLKLLEALRA